MSNTHRNRILRGLRARIGAFVENASITRKLMLIVMVPTLVSLLLACALLFGFTVTFIRQWTHSEAASMARMTAKQLSAAYQVKRTPGGWTSQWDPGRAESVLHLLEHPRILAAALYDGEGKRIASYYKDRVPVELSLLLPARAGGHTSGGVLHYYHPLEALPDPSVAEVVVIGTLYLRADTGLARNRVALFALAVLLIIALCAVIAYLLSERLQRIISGPITHLSLLARMISEERDYSLRAVKQNNDEVGRLVDEFNTMLERIEEHRHALQEAHDKLEDRVQERTEELQREALEHKQTATDLKREAQVRTAAEGELRKAKAAAEAASHAKGEFVAHVSHEIRTPMSGILGMAELLRGTALTAPQRRYLDSIRRSGGAVLNIIGDVLDYSKIEAGQIELIPAPFNLHTVCEDVIDLLSPPAREKDIALFLRYDARAPRRLVGDAARITQILTNLTANAIKFTHQGHVLLDVTGTAREGDLRGMRIYVEDTGIGAARENLHRIFGEYVQADAAVEKAYGGTGLGLAIAKHMVELMGGDIGVQSREGVGSRFIFNLSLPADQGPDTVLTANPLEGVKALVIDANRARRKALRQILEAWGMRVTRASSVPGASQAKPPAEPALILVEDHGLEMDAEDCARALRAAGHGGALVALTSRAEKGHAAQLHDAGYAGYLSRPVRQAELRLVLEKVLRRGEDTALVTRYEDGGPIGKAAETEHFWSDAKVLVVDDNEVNREVATEMLRSFGCTVTEAGDGISAVRLVEKGAAFDLILMDCHMIEMDGYEAARRIRAFEGSEAHVPIVAVTAMAFMGVKERCLDVGMNDYLLKPFNPEILVKYMKRWLPKERHGYKEAADTPDEAEAAPPAPEPSPTLDMDKALWVTGGNHRLFHRTAKVFLRHMPERFEELSDAVQACEAEEVTRLAHSIKGASASVGGEALCEAAFVLEVAGRENREIEFGKCFEEMRARYGALEVALLEQLPGEEATKEAAEPEGS